MSQATGFLLAFVVAAGLSMWAVNEGRMWRTMGLGFFVIGLWMATLFIVRRWMVP
jgi:hypothetical protein